MKKLLAIISVLLLSFLVACTGTDPDEKLVEAEVEKIKETSLQPYLGKIDFKMKDTRRDEDVYHLNYTVIANVNEDFADLSMKEINDLMMSSISELGYEPFDCGARNAKCTIYNIVINFGGNKYEVGQFDKAVKLNGKTYDGEDEKKS